MVFLNKNLIKNLKLKIKSLISLWIHSYLFDKVQKVVQKKKNHNRVKQIRLMCLSIPYSDTLSVVLAALSVKLKMSHLCQISFSCKFWLFFL